MAEISMALSEKKLTQSWKIPTFSNFRGLYFKFPISEIAPPFPLPKAKGLAADLLISWPM